MCYIFDSTIPHHFFTDNLFVIKLIEIVLLPFVKHPGFSQKEQSADSSSSDNITFVERRG